MELAKEFDPIVIGRWKYNKDSEESNMMQYELMTKNAKKKGTWRWEINEVTVYSGQQMEVNKNTTQAMNPVPVRWRAETQGQIEKKEKGKNQNCK